MTGAPALSRRRAVLRTVAGLTAAGAVVGVLWAMLAPSIGTVTALNRVGERVDGFLGRQADNLFVAAAMLTGLLSSLAVVSAVLVWQWRAHRGPALAAALWLGQVAAAAAAAATGAALAHWRYGTPDRAGAELTPRNRVAYFVEAPPVFFGHSPVQIAVTLLLPAALAAGVYAVMVIGSTRDDLGGWPPQDPPSPPAGWPANGPTALAAAPSRRRAPGRRFRRGATFRHR